MLDLAVTLLKRMSELEPDPNKRAWYRLFRHMDDDGSGRITFSELVDMVRSELRITLDEMSSSLLKSVWAALDVDSSGFITAGEFGVFMRKGEAHLRASQPQSTWKQRLASSRRLEAEAVTLALTKEKRAMVGVEAAEPAQVRSTSCPLLSALNPHRLPCMIRCSSSRSVSIDRLRGLSPSHPSSAGIGSSKLWTTTGPGRSRTASCWT